jgi:hypothetical protein
MGNLKKDSGPISGIHLSPGCPAVRQIFQDGQRLPDDLMGFAAFNVDHKTDSAGVMLETGIIQSLF